MKLVKSLLLFCALFLAGQMVAQDIHWSLFNMSPLTINPANTGAFEGTFRIGGIYRDQYNVAGINGFRTPSFYVDAPIIRGFRKNDWIGVGATFFSDKAGTGDLGYTGTLFSAAYHLAMNKKGTSVLTFGLQGGMMQRKIDGMELTLGSELDGTYMTGESPDRQKIGESTNFFDFNAGVQLSTQLNKTSDLKIGVALRHILTPEYGLINNAQEDLPMRITAHGTFNTMLTDKWSLSPTFIINNMASANEFDIQGWLGYQLNPDFRLNFGPGYRLGDAVNFLIGVDYKQFKVAAAYDLTVSDLSSANNNQGGFEIAVWYIAKIFKKPTIKPVIFCPRF